MQIKRRGSMKNAPLAYVFVMVQIQPITKYREFVPDVQEELRDILPNFNELKRTDNNIEITPGGEVKTSTKETAHYYFTDLENKYGVMIRDDRVILHAVDYKGFSDFRKRFENILLKIKDVLRIKYYRGVGIRYVDRIAKINDLDIEDIIQSDFLPKKFGEHCLEGSSQGRVEFYNSTTYGHLFLRSSMVKVQPPVPQDLFESYATLIGGRSENVENTLILDTDHVFADNSKLRAFEVSSVFDELDAMHEVCKDVFNNIVNVAKLEEA